MGDFIDVASAILAQSEQRLANSAQNLANISTTGYKRHLSFDTYLASNGAGGGQAVTTDFSVGKRIDTGNPSDLAILGEGFFVVRGPQGLRYTRAGQFQQDTEGRLVTQDGSALQLDSGSDLVLRGGKFAVDVEGVVTEDGQLVGKLAIMRFAAAPTARAVDGADFSDGAGMVEGERP